MAQAVPVRVRLSAPIVYVLHTSRYFHLEVCISDVCNDIRPLSKPSDGLEFEANDWGGPEFTQVNEDRSKSFNNEIKSIMQVLKEVYCFV